MLENKILEALTIFDQINSQDSNILVFQNEKYPKEILYANWLTHWIEKLNPIVSDSLRLASRCQHLKRWAIPREQYAIGLKGYMQWKKELLNFHAEESEKVLISLGIERTLIERVKVINLKKDIKNNPEVQTMEDALCLVTLEFQLEDFSLKHDDEKIITIIKKSWVKMSEPAKILAKSIPYSDRVLKLVLLAIQE